MIEQVKQQDNKLILQEKSTNDLINVPDTIPNSINAQLALADQLVKSGLSPFKKKEDALIAIMYGRELGFSPIVAMQNINAINGKASIGIHLITAMLQKKGILIQVTEDYEPVIPPNTNNPPTGAAAANRRTTVEITRDFLRPNGEYKTVVTKLSYTLMEAHLAGLLDKDNWKKMPKIMLRTRCITLAARLAASDIIQGLFEHDELIEISAERRETSQNNTSTQESPVVETAVEVKENEEINTTTEQIK